MMVTVKDVAREAGTSTAVVSYVINSGPRNVKESTRLRVLAAIDRLGYRPNANARALRAASSPVLGVIASDISNSYCAELVIAIENAAIARRHSLLVGNAMKSDDREERHLATFIEHQVRGIVFIGSTEPLGPGITGTERTDGHQPPRIRFDRPVTAPGETGILVENFSGAFDATTHLLKHGYRECALFTGPRTLYGVPERTRGWEDALCASGLDPTQQRVFASDFDRYSAFDVARTVLARPDRPRAIFVQSDEQAIGVMLAASQLGVRIPEDIAIASFDGIRESSLVTPDLTTVVQPFEQMAELAVRTLLDPDGDGAPTNISLPLSLRVRGSCGGH